MNGIEISLIHLFTINKALKQLNHFLQSVLFEPTRLLKFKPIIERKRKLRYNLLNISQFDHYGTRNSYSI